MEVSTMFYTAWDRLERLMTAFQSSLNIHLISDLSRGSKELDKENPDLPPYLAAKI